MQERDGWYSAHAFERIKTVLRHKFFSLLEGHIPTDEECEALLVVDPASNKATAVRSKKLRPGKHNMAKGALRPEDAAVRSFASLLLSVVLNRSCIFVGCEVACDTRQECENFAEPKRYRIVGHLMQ